MEPSRKPKIFISSTIYDFRDLRSALKYWLNEMGCETLLSEHNDFEKPIEENSYQACLKSIEQADFFILLIGSRTGGSFKSGDSTITQQEYRHAYELLKNDKLKILAFVREEVWTVKEDRKEIEDLLRKNHKAEIEKTGPETQKLIESIPKLSSKFVRDADVIFNFLHEVGRIEEMKAAVKSGQDYPKGNWIHQFTYFEDIVNVLKIELNLRQRIQKIAMDSYLKNEITSNLQLLFLKFNESAIPLCDIPEKSRSYLTNDSKGYSDFPREDLSKLLIFLLKVVNLKNLSDRFINQALMSGEYLDFNKNTRQYEQSHLGKMLFHLSKEIERLRSFISQGNVSSTSIIGLINFIQEKSKPDSFGNAIKRLKNDSEILYIFSLHNVVKNLTVLQVKILQSLFGLSVSEEYQVLPPMPFEEEAQKISDEHPSTNEILNLVGITNVE